MSAMQRSPVNPLELSVLLKGAMLKGNELSDKVIFAKGVAVSYSYERV